jgi:hypothetical protein
MFSFFNNQSKKANGRNEEYLGVDAIKSNKTDLFNGSKKMSEVQQLKLKNAEINI